MNMAGLPGLPAEETPAGASPRTLHGSYVPRQAGSETAGTFLSGV
ncbi:MAG: hypothetical protein OJF52_001654 [Nitrospira sp.]|nr:MAG: hypothetical protein OJF52_001654 [Nitrospira sp.]